MSRMIFVLLLLHVYVVATCQTSIANSGNFPYTFLPENKLQFRLYAPFAKEVRIAGWDIMSYTGHTRSGEKPFPGVALQKDSTGWWQVTFNNMQHEPYQYFYWVDGVRTLDPANKQTLQTYQLPFSVAEGTNQQKPAFWQQKKVPHGTVHLLSYYSAVLQTERPLVVYTPPGYETGRQTYPVLYLLHGAGEIATSWVAAGKANNIADNLLAAGTAKPCIIVMPLGHPDGTEGRVDSSLLTGAHRFSWMEKELLQHIIPFTETHFRVRKDRESRALAGLSMGAAQTAHIGLRHLDQFAYIGLFSAGDKDLAANHPQLVTDAARSNRQLKLLFLGVGDLDRVGNVAGQPASGIFYNMQAMAQQLKTHGINHRFTILPGVDHTWYAWRRLLHNDFLPALWK